MNPFYNILNKRKSVDDPVECIGIFSIILFAFLLVARLVHHYSWQLLYGYLFFLGWFSWTFFEYMLHRFVWHSKRTNKRDSETDTFNHLYHHQHPAEIRITYLKRALLVTGSLILVLISIWIHNYFTILVGFICGFTTYNLTHLLLHKKFMQKVFAKNVRYCKLPQK